jgi:hypothetical protein
LGARVPKNIHCVCARDPEKKRARKIGRRKYREGQKNLEQWRRNQHQPGMYAVPQRGMKDIETKETQGTDTLEIPEKRGTPEMQENMDTSEILEKIDTPEIPEKREIPEIHETDTSETPERDTPEIQEKMDTPEIPEKREIPEIQEKIDPPGIHEKIDPPEILGTRNTKTKISLLCTSAGITW